MIEHPALAACDMKNLGRKLDLFLSKTGIYFFSFYHWCINRSMCTEMKASQWTEIKNSETWKEIMLFSPWKCWHGQKTPSVSLFRKKSNADSTSKTFNDTATLAFALKHQKMKRKVDIFRLDKNRARKIKNFRASKNT